MLVHVRLDLIGTGGFRQISDNRVKTWTIWYLGNRAPPNAKPSGGQATVSGQQKAEMIRLGLDTRLTNVNDGERSGMDIYAPQVSAPRLTFPHLSPNTRYLDRL